MLLKKLLLITALSCSQSCLAFDDYIQVGRYTTISSNVREEQKDLLKQIVTVRFPQSTYTIGAAFKYLLDKSGYTLVSVSKMNPEFKKTLQLSLPIVDRRIGPVTLKNALSALAGPVFVLHDDPVNRQINFILRKEFKYPTKIH